MYTLIAVALSGLHVATATPPAPDAPAETSSAPAHEAAEADQPTPGQRVWRVVGDMPAAAHEDGVWRWRQCAIPTALPLGYPAPTPPGAIEIKDYPVARRAQVSMTTSMERSGNTGFFPLFGHISRNDIPMTAPVEMDFSDVPEKAGEPVEWTMAFLYEGPDQGELGPDARDPRVQVVETPAVTVLALGAMGYNRSPEQMLDAEARLQTWLDESDEWIRAGETRWLGYNGPEVRPQHRWSEVQIPIKRYKADSDSPE